MSFHPSSDRRIGLALTLGFLVGLATPAASSALPPPKPVTLTVLAPVSPSEFPPLIGRFLNTPTETSGGWPITLQLTADNNQLLGIATELLPPFPENGRRGFLVFDVGPDPCLSFLPLKVLASGDPCFHAPVDETYLEFTPGVVLPGVNTAIGNSDQLLRLTDTGGGGRPTILTQSFNGTSLQTNPSPIGPFTGGPDTLHDVCLSDFRLFDIGQAQACPGGPCPLPDFSCHSIPDVLDGYGYGASAILPGLVLVADAGPSVMLQQDPAVNPNGDFLLRDGQGHRQARNLGGFVNAVGYELNNALKLTSVVAHMTVPGFLFDPIVVEDRCVGIPFFPEPAGGPDPNACKGAPIFRIDGGPETTTPPDPNRVITFRLFVVNRAAPDVLADVNGDGIVDSKDAVAAGYALLSNEVKVQVKLRNQAELPFFFYDFDGNGDPSGPIVLPAGGGGITPVPR